MNLHVAFAIFQRNFVAYFSNPTGYVFIGLFVALTAIAQFWLPDFYTKNLANLDQLNGWFPLIMLVFVPAITMSIWAEERRQGTDETLLTLPAADFDVVLGKYLAAVGIYTVALIFSGSNAIVLAWTGWPDWGIIATNYLGYWLVGVAMLGPGMIASFLTRNLTVAFILGFLLNVPLVALEWAGLIAIDEGVANVISKFSIVEQFRDFGVGLVRLSSILYFLGIAAVSVYISLVLIGQRHWAGQTHGRDERDLQSPNGLSDAAPSKVGGIALGLLICLLLLGGVLGLAYQLAYQPESFTALIVGLWIAAGLGWLVLAIGAWFLGGQRYLEYLPASLLVAVLGYSFVGLVVWAVAPLWSSRTYEYNHVISVLSLATIWAIAQLMTVWFLNRGGEQFLLRTICLLVIVGGLVVVVDRHDFPIDFSEEELSTLSPQTVQTLRALSDSQGEVAEAGDQAKISSTSFPVDQSLAELDDVYVGTAIRFTSGKLKGQKSRVIGYEVDPEDQTRVVTISPALEGVPEAGDDFVLERAPVRIHAFVSPDVPEGYVETKLNLINNLRRFDQLGGNQIELTIHTTDTVSDNAVLAKEQFDIEPQPVQSRNRDGFSLKDIFLGVGFQCGTSKSRIAFFDLGLPLEYELMRQVAAVSQQERKKVGVIETDASLFGRFNPQQMQQQGQWDLINELRQQYEVVPVRLDSIPTPQEYDVLLVVQPSSLPPQELQRLIQAIESGIPTAIFEDPLCPAILPLPGTSMPRRSAQAGPMGRMPRPPPKGNIDDLWSLLQVAFPPDELLIHNYRPVPQLSSFEYCFLGTGDESSSNGEFNPEIDVSRGLQQLLLLIPGHFRQIKKPSSQLEFTPLVETGDSTGVLPFQKVVRVAPLGPFGPPYILQRPPQLNYSDGQKTVAALIRGTAPKKSTSFSQPNQPLDQQPSKKDSTAEINVALVSDVDCISPVFFQLRRLGRDNPSNPLAVETDNVTLVLNLLDKLAGDERFIELRSRRRKHRTLTTIEGYAKNFKEEVQKRIKELEDQRSKKMKSLQEQHQDQLDELKTQSQSQDSLRYRQQRGELERFLSARAEEAETKLKREFEQEVKRARREKQLLPERRIQNQFKLVAILLPPIPLLLIAVVVFLIRRARETEGVSSSRLR